MNGYSVAGPERLTLAAGPAGVQILLLGRVANRHESNYDTIAIGHQPIVS